MQNKPRGKLGPDKAVAAGLLSARPAVLGLLLCLSFSAICGCRKDPSGKASLLCYVGGTMRPAMEELARTYQQETGHAIDIDYGGSGENLIKVETSRRGDLYVGHDPFLGKLMNKGLGEDAWTVAVLTPVIVVRKGNPKAIKGLADLARDGIKTGLTDPYYSTLGHICPIMFDRAGMREKIERNVITRMKMGGQVANAVSLGNLDAAIVWNAVAHLRRDKLDTVQISPEYQPHPEADAVTTATYGRIDMSQVSVFIVTLKCSKRPRAARAFAEFVASRRGRAVFARYGFSPARIRGPKATLPTGKAVRTLRLYCGAGLRPAAAEVIERFTARTGVKVETDYSGSGMLISRIKLSRDGDLFMPGDVWYLEQVEKEGLVQSKTMVSYFVPVILVQKGNPKAIRGLADLTRSGIRIALGNPEACQIGRLSERIFTKNGIDGKAIKANLVFSGVTVNELGLQVKMGRADAAMVWDAIAAYYADCADVVRIPTKQNEISRVAIGILNSSRNKHLAEEFVRFLVSDTGKSIFQRHHYQTSLPE